MSIVSEMTLVVLLEDSEVVEPDDEVVEVEVVEVEVEEPWLVVTQIPVREESTVKLNLKYDFSL